MKTWLIIIVIVAGVIGIKSGIDHHSEKEYMISVVKKNEDAVYEGLKDDDKYNRIKSIEIDYSKLERNPSELGDLMTDK